MERECEETDGARAMQDGAQDASIASAHRGDPASASEMDLHGHATAPLDPIYAWGMVLEPVEVLIERTSRFIEQLAREAYERGEGFGDEELEERFLAFFDRLVEEGGFDKAARRLHLTSPPCPSASGAWRSARGGCWWRAPRRPSPPEPDAS